MREIKPESLIFDMDGTIVSTVEDITDSVNVALLQFGLAPISVKECIPMLGNGSVMLIKRAMKGKKEELFDDVFNTYYSYYHQHYCVKTKPYDGLIDVLLEAKRRGILLFVYTNKPHDIALEVLNRCFPKDLFSLLIGIPLGGKVKPDPTPFIDAVSSYHLDFSKACYFGDSTTDIETATNLHCGGIYSVLWGYQSFETLSSFHLKPTAYLENPKEIQLVLDEKL